MADLTDLLTKTSRTFGLCIPLLPEPLRREVTVAYLLFRIADTFEDATEWTKEQRIDSLQRFAQLVESPTREASETLSAEWVAAAPVAHDGYVELLSEVPFVLEEFERLPDAARQVVDVHTRRTASGMGEFLSRGDDPHQLQLEDFNDLRDYCYVVAGIVGEMLTELYLLGDERLRPVAHYLRPRARHFGEGLQLTNIVKDFAVDASEGRSFIRSDEIANQAFVQARVDLDIAAEYTQSIQESGADRGIVEFNALPALLARATLDRVAERPGGKLSRPEVFAIVGKLSEDLDRGRPAIRRLEDAPLIEADRG